MQRRPQQAGPGSRTPPSAPSATPTPAWAAADCSAAEPVGGLQEYYYELCMEKSQEIKPFILHILQEVDEEIEKGLVGITLNVAGNCHLMPVERVTGEDFWILCRILKNNPYINASIHLCSSGLDVRYNLISDVGASYAAKLLQKNTTLKHLRMTGNKIENKGGMFFAAMLQINSSLEKLDVGDCDLGMQSVIAFATVLTQNQTIKGLNLNRPILYGEQEESTVHLGHMLKENQCLVELHMCKHDIKNCGMKQLCDALYLNRTLRYLDVSCNKITQDGMVCLADVLKSNTTLEVIDLSFNRIENAGANYLSDALASHNRTLKALSVVSNKIEGEGLVALSQSMKTNPTLSNIYIWGNKFDEATRVAYSDLIHMGRLKSDNTDVEPFVVDGHVYLAEVSNGLKRHYYWTPGYGEACSPSSNAGFTLVPVGQYL
ncbi:leucine-rich repeat-containing protein 34 isoform X4 [Balaenoptera musculus]|uniref:Leucine-rich repeat-containing protein 34 isoform X4 n=1 Tax=Balaenoptera musculus TaxID=9771 RepID=A0A8B8X8D1_BALMU|nr:leucine-rich repeat-containing protein 34 isoform X4 [Balaenoptera musculus]